MKAAKMISRIDTILTHDDSALRADLIELREIISIMAENERAKRQVSAAQQLKVINSILKVNEKTRRDIAYPVTTADGAQIICDDFQAYRFKTQRDDLPARPADAGDCSIDFEKLFSAAEKNAYTLELPTLSEVEDEIAAQRAAYTGKRSDFCPTWDFRGQHPFAPVVNALYLKNALTLFPDAKTIAFKNVVSALYISCEDGDGILLPLRCALKRYNYNLSLATDEQLSDWLKYLDSNNAQETEIHRIEILAEVNWRLEQAGKQRLRSNNSDAKALIDTRMADRREAYARLVNASATDTAIDLDDFEKIMRVYMNVV